MLFFPVSDSVIVIVREHKSWHREVILSLFLSFPQIFYFVESLMRTMLITLDVLCELPAIPLSHSGLIKSFCPRAQFSAQSI